MDLKLGISTNDLELSKGDLQLVSGTDSIAQHLRIRLRFFLGEWFLDPRLGIPYFQSILIKNPQTNVVKAIFRSAILSTPGVESITELIVDFDGATRKLNVSFNAILTDSDQPLTFTTEFIV